MKKFFLIGVPLAIITIIFGTIYVVSQQTIRLSANTPQIQLAEEAASRLDSGANPNSVLPRKINIRNSSATFLIVYDKSGKVVAGSGEIEGRVPMIPYGVLQNTPTTGYNAVTWQISNTRIASVEAQAQHYYVLAGRSLAEPEKLIDTIGKLTLFGYILTLVIAAGGLLIWGRKS